MYLKWDPFSEIRLTLPDALTGENKSSVLWADKRGNLQTYDPLHTQELVGVSLPNTVALRSADTEGHDDQNPCDPLPLNFPDG